MQSQYSPSDVARFLAKIDREGSPHPYRTELGRCWLWTSHCHPQGHGMLSHGGRGGRPQYAHRVAYQVYRGPIPDDQEVCHSCDNPPCVNPSHLFLGTHTDNMRDMYTKGRRLAAVGERVGSARLTAPQVLEIRRQWAAGGVTKSAIARAFGVDGKTIYSIVTFRSWRHLRSA